MTCMGSQVRVLYRAPSKKPCIHQGYGAFVILTKKGCSTRPTKRPKQAEKLQKSPVQKKVAQGILSFLGVAAGGGGGVGGTHRSRPTDGYRFRVPFIRRGRVSLPGAGRRGRRPLRGVAAVCHSTDIDDYCCRVRRAGSSRLTVGIGAVCRFTGRGGAGWGGQRQRHPAKNERMVEPVPLG